MQNKFQQVIKAWLIAGTLDLLAAFLYYFLITGNNPIRILKFIAGGIFGEYGFNGTASMYLYGLLFHYLIAFCFSVFFMMIFSRISFLKNLWLLRGVLYGIFVWTVMNLLVLPLSQLPQRPFDPFNAIINMLILIVCIGIPLSYLAGNENNRSVVQY